MPPSLMSLSPSWCYSGSSSFQLPSDVYLIINVSVWLLSVFQSTARFLSFPFSDQMYMTYVRVESYLGYDIMLQ